MRKKIFSIDIWSSGVFPGFCWKFLGNAKGYQVTVDSDSIVLINILGNAGEIFKGIGLINIFFDNQNDTIDRDII